VLDLFGVRRHAAQAQFARFVEGHLPEDPSEKTVLARIDGV
jgi:hypothetical protein